ncbi:PadR family transcriptional regulator [Ekhidna sp. To15]|uniref:PadR family transcriptional regulator n=1 Tax=Ekhidna sp. To15 TaxID=3395267 RepID=UPI003F522EB3
MKGTNLGEFEELLLLVVLILQEDAYMLRIKDEINNQVNRSISMGALHTTLSRLEHKEFLKSEMGGATKERGGRRKRIYELTADGKAALNEVKELRANLWNQVPSFELKFIHV